MIEKKVIPDRPVCLKQSRTENFGAQLEPLVGRVNNPGRLMLVCPLRAGELVADCFAIETS